ncbi:granzyme-like protein 1 [Anoplophora glabripennis]|uniref:granzyme-like protein 1 n=1 Tax=Anoplophora glabripennis TaxID=217634 RepID=UPI000873A7E8|nr:granzyme-like protein 1 [Anoplophora glabripennis]
MVFRLIYLLVLLFIHLKSGQQLYQTSDVMSRPGLFTAGAPHVSPYTVAIIRENNWHKRCAGTLISDSFVLTAAQCVDCESAEVILGAYDILVREKTQVRQYISEDDVIFHPYYDPRTLDNDIALVKLPMSVKLTPFVNIAELPDEDFHLDYGTKAYVTGWEKRLAGYSNILTQAEVSILSKDKCISFWPTARIADNKFCGSNTRREGQIPHLLGADCIIDPGSPLTLHGNPDILIGFVSGDARCGSLLPEIFTNVASHKKWIDEVVGSSKGISSDYLKNEYMGQ